MDFFSLRHPNNSEDSQNTKDFASAIQDRFGSNALLTTRLTPVQEPVHPVRNVAIHPTTVTTSSLNDWLTSPSTLILDIRPHATYAQARIPNALSLSVPSTLLKRPLFSLQRLAAMLASPSARSKFLSFKSSTRILVYDADAHQIPEYSNIYGLLKKFANDGYEGELAWLKGGFQSVWRERRDLVDQTPPPRETGEDDEDEGRATRIDAPSTGGLPGEDNHQHHHRPHLGHLPVPGPAPSNPASFFLRPSQLAAEAFSFDTTTSKSKFTSAGTAAGSKKNAGTNVGAGTSRPAFNPFFDTIRQNVELSQGITERIPLRLPKRVRKRVDDLPFDWLKEIARRADVIAPPSAVTPMPGTFGLFQRTPSQKTPSISHPKAVSPNSMSSESVSSGSVSTSETPSPPDAQMVEEGMEALAMQFYRIELAEQRRLMGVMEHHSKESSTFDAQRRGREKHREGGQQEMQVEDDSSRRADFPFSITAGVEKGAKNRYRHIWPFEHARVRLHTDDEDTGEDSTTEGSPARSGALFGGLTGASTSSISLLSADVPGSTRSSSRASAMSYSYVEPLDKDDYVNASYVQPLGTNKRYIATQGPLEATFDDFWRLCWEQNVHVIVMLTKEVEGSMVKCGAYWADVGSASSPLLPDPVRKFGPITLTLTDKVGYTNGMRAGREGGISLMEQNKEGLKKLNAIATDAITGGGGGFEFPMMQAAAPPKHRYRSGKSHRKRRKERARAGEKSQVPGLEPSSATEATEATDVTSDSAASLNLSDDEDIDIGRITTIKRTFELTHDQYPESSPRTVIQLQYLEWPDMNVPDDPRGVLDLLERVDLAVSETGGSGEQDPEDLHGGLNIEEEFNPFHDTRLESHKIGGDGESQHSREELHAKGKRRTGGARWEKKEMLMDKTTGIAKHALGSKYARPLLLHCSAGVGRTGGYIALDAVLDGVKREMRKQRESAAKSASIDPSAEPRNDSMNISEPSRIQSTSVDAGSPEDVSRPDSNSDDEDISADQSAAMDVDMEGANTTADAAGPTVPITMSGAQHDVIHVPTVVVPQSREGSANSNERGGSSGEGNMSEDEASGGGNSADAEASASAQSGSPPMVEDVRTAPKAPEKKSKKKQQKKQIEKMTAIAHETGGKGLVPMEVDSMEVDRDEDSPSGGSNESSAGGRSGDSGGSGSASGSGTSGDVSRISGGSGSAEGSGGSSRDGGLSNSIVSAGSVGAGSGESGGPANVGVPSGTKHAHHSHHHLHGRPLSLLTKKWAQNVHDSQLDNGSSGSGGLGGSASDLSSSMIIEPLPGASSRPASLPPISESELSSGSGSGSGSSGGSRPTKTHHPHHHHPAHPSHLGHPHRSSSPARISVSMPYASAQLSQHLRDQQRQKKKMDQLRQKGGHQGVHAHGHGTTGAANTNIGAPSLSSASTGSLSGSTFPSISDSDEDAIMLGTPMISSMPTTVSEGGSSDKGKGRESMEILGIKEEERKSVEDEAAKVAGEVAATKQERLLAPAGGERARTFSAPEPQIMGPPKSIPGARVSMAERAKAAMGQSPGQAFALSMPAFNLNYPIGRSGTAPATDPRPDFMKQLGKQPIGPGPSMPPQSSTTKATVFNLPSGPTTGQSDVTATTTTTTKDTQIEQPQPVKLSPTLFGNRKLPAGSFPFGAQSSLSTGIGARHTRSDDASGSGPNRHTTVDYKEPRELHVEDGSPVSLSKFEAPIWEVIQDMREQRMSLCQSLRQYVFVHAAIVEGALRLVDEERERESAAMATMEQGMNEERMGSLSVGALLQGGAPAELNPQQIEMSERQGLGYMGMDIDSSTATSRQHLGPGPFTQLRQLEGSMSSTSLASTGYESASVASSVMSSPSKKGKRGASPTELVKEGKKGEALLSKRPSLKRKTESPPESQGRLDTVPQSPNARPSRG